MFYTKRSQLRILIDPLTVHLDASHQLIHEQVELTMVLRYLHLIHENGVTVEVLFPEFLWDNSWHENYYSFVPGDPFIEQQEQGITLLKERNPLSEWAKSKSDETKKYLTSKSGEYLKMPKISLSDPQSFLRSFEDGSLLLYRDAEYIFKYGYLELIDLYYQNRCDLLLTSNRVLQGEKNILSKKFRLFVTDYPDIYDRVETFLKGHQIYISTSNPIYGLDISTFYPMTDVRLQRYMSLWGAILQLKNDTKMSNYLRVMLYHRYTFLRYSCDQIEFNVFQAERLDDEKLRSGHYFLASYHLNSFYLNLWGFLDNLAWVFNQLYDLGFDQKTANNVSFSSKKYLKSLATKAPKIKAVLDNPEIKKWLDDLAIKRHPAAHREPLFLSPLYNKKDMSLISERMVPVETKTGQGLFEAINHLKFDYEQLHKIMGEYCLHFGVN